ncbi:MAG: BCCT family transporter [Chitinivibrionales bacterium]|nr:BCCT family transporter [Chitinivibrionales bacterium]MBD3355887.1 BCCT family transporter [Chitinivibrionales bacterium]
MMNPPVFFGAGGFVVALIFFGGLWTGVARELFNATLEFITLHLGWYYVLTVTFFFFFVIWLYFSPYGGIKLGGENARPEFNRPAWFTMLFAAGMGMGMVFWGVAEPIKHYSNPPFAEPFTMTAAKEAMRFSFFHWGFHPWAIYIIFGLGIAYFHFRHGLPLAPRSLLYPIVGDRFKGWLGHAADIICTVGTLLGVATSLGLGAMQINSGLNRLLAVGYDLHIQVVIIAVITAIAITSIVSGLDRGIKYLSITNIALMFVLMSFVFWAGPTLYQIRLFITTLGDYLQNIVETSLWIDVGPDSSWQTDWTLFYWGWWLSWSPFVGVFIARISKGRTIREFIFYIFLVPSLATLLWFAVFGGTALYLELNGLGTISSIVDENVAMSLNALLRYLPLASITQWLGLFLIVIFFITSSDSGSLVDDMVTSGGHPNPPVAQRIFWGSAEGAAAAVMLVVGGLKALQAASLSAGLVQSFLLLASCYGLTKALRSDKGARSIVRSSQ